MTSITFTDSISLEKWLRLKEVLVIGLVGGIPPIPGRFLRNLLYRSILVRMGKFVRIEQLCQFVGSHQIELGNRVHIGQCSFLDASKLATKFLWVTMFGFMTMFV
ncbi:MAG: hypothetical protein HC862_21225 [Scytonema sp. RU_4_4]|nr:hypothetical protein [Scytonema sp. RU_4_4]